MKKARHKSRQEDAALDNKGYSLVEVLIAMTVFSIGMLAVTSLQTMSFQTTQGVSMRNDAMLIAQEELEVIGNLRFPYLTTRERVETKAVLGVNYTLNVAVGDAYGPAGNRARDITVTVSYPLHNETKNLIFNNTRAEAEDNEL